MCDCGSREDGGRRIDCRRGHRRTASRGCRRLRRWPSGGGLARGYDLDHDLAFQAFERALEADRDDSASHRFYAATAWISLLFDQGAVTVADYLGQATSDLTRQPPNRVVDRTLRLHLDRAIALAEARVAQHPADADAHYQLGAAYGLQASYRSTIEGRVFGSLGPARRAYKARQKVLELDPSRKDAGLIVGLYAYGVNATPVHVRLFARLAGFGGGRERAIRLVEDAAAYPSDAQPNAMSTRADDELLRRLGDDRDWFNTARPGSSNAGHDVWSRIGTDDNRRALIEYLKTL